MGFPDTSSVGDPHDAAGLVEAVQDQVRRRTTPLVRAILHARAVRAWSKTPHGRIACTRELNGGAGEPQPNSRAAAL